MSITKQQDKRIENALISFMEEWNDKHPKNKLNPFWVDRIKMYFEHIYTVGVEDAFRMINKEYSKYQMNTHVSNVMVKKIISLHTYEL